MAWEPLYISTDQLAAFVRTTTVIDEPQLTLAITAASRAIDRHTNRQFGQVVAPEPRFYTARWSARQARWVVDVDDLMTSTGLSVLADLDDDGVPEAVIEAFELSPRNAQSKGRPWERLIVRPSSTSKPNGRDGAVRVTARWGWLAIPEPVKEACLLQASRVFARRDAPFGVAGSPDAGSEVRLLAKVDPDVAVSLQTYRRIFNG